MIDSDEKLNETCKVPKIPLLMTGQLRKYFDKADKYLIREENFGEKENTNFG